MDKWKVEVEQDHNGKYRWRHVPRGTEQGVPHAGPERWETPEDARDAGEKALAFHHEKEPER